MHHNSAWPPSHAFSIFTPGASRGFWEIILVMYIHRFSRCIHKARSNLYNDGTDEKQITKIRRDVRWCVTLDYARSLLGGTNGVRNVICNAQACQSEIETELFDSQDSSRLFDSSELLDILLCASNVSTAGAYVGWIAMADAGIWPVDPEVKGAARWTKTFGWEDEEKLGLGNCIKNSLNQIERRSTWMKSSVWQK